MLQHFGELKMSYSSCSSSSKYFLQVGLVTKRKFQSLFISNAKPSCIRRMTWKVNQIY